MSYISSLPEKSTNPRFIIEESIHEQRFGIFKVRCSKSNDCYIAKLYKCDDKQNTSLAFEQELEVLTRMQGHKNIIGLKGNLKQAHIKARSTSYFKKYNNILYSCILLECAHHGDLYELVDSLERIPNLISANIFARILDGLESMHAAGIAHMDLKMENMVISNDYTPKIIDFELSYMEEGNIVNYRSGGTKLYRAPEVANSKCEDHKKADVYSLGICLFLMHAGAYPYDEYFLPDNEGKRYLSPFYKPTDYWKQYEQQLCAKFSNIFNDTYMPFTESFKTLITGMLQVDPQNRYSLQDVRNSEWYQEIILLDDHHFRNSMYALVQKSVRIRHDREVHTRIARENEPTIEDYAIENNRMSEEI
jgi:serine/threonine protein kinase